MINSNHNGYYHNAMLYSCNAMCYSCNAMLFYTKKSAHAFCKV